MDDSFALLDVKAEEDGIRRLYDKTTWQRGAAGQRELIAPAADSCEQVAQAAG